MMPILRAGLIGLGAIGKQHARILSSLEGVHFVGSCDPIVDVGSVSENGPVFRDLETLIEQKIDYAIVAVPTSSHFQVSIQLADSNVNALIEKPLSHNSSTGNEIVRKFSEKKLLAAVGHIERFNPAVTEAMNRLDMLGKLFQITSCRVGPSLGRIQDVGVALDLVTHDVDLTRVLSMQEYSYVSAQTYSRSSQSQEDMLIASAKLNNGTIVNHIVNRLSPKKERITLLIGENGVFEIDTLKMELTYYSNGIFEKNRDNLENVHGPSEDNVNRLAVAKKEPLLIEHENFRDALLGKKSHLSTLEDGLKSVQVAEAFLKSAKEGVTIQV